MKNQINVCKVLCNLAIFSTVAFILATACAEKIWSESEEGLLHLSFGGDYRLLTRAGINLPDTCDFRLQVRYATGETVYDGRYGDAPEAIKVRPGSCIVSVISSLSQAPAFDNPVFGDEQCVVVPSGGNVSARLVCRQLNCGVRLKIAKEFLSECPQSVLFLKTSEGKLMYSYSEKRYAHFSPGTLSLVMVTGEEEKALFTRTLYSGEMLTLGVSVSSSSGSTSGGSASGGSSLNRGIRISLDTARVWSNASCTIGGKPSGGGSGSDSGSGSGGGFDIPQNAVTINEAKTKIGQKGIWVSAYIVGGNLTSAGAKYDPPFTSRTNLLIGPRSMIVDRSSGMSVQLSAGKIRDALNLVDHPGLLGRKVMLKGDIVDAYYGLTGIKNVSDYRVL